MAQSPDITQLLIEWNSGDELALEKLTPVVYEELRKLARSALAGERGDHTLSATALVHESYLKLVDQRKVAWGNRVHFFGAAARIMRRVLVDYARTRVREKRGGASVRVDLSGDQMSLPAGSEGWLTSLDDALNELAEVDPRRSRVVEMKFFGGMTIPEIGQILSISEVTVERDWKLARAWLIGQLEKYTP